MVSRTGAVGVVESGALTRRRSSRRWRMHGPAASIEYAQLVITDRFNSVAPDSVLTKSNMYSTVVSIFGIHTGTKHPCGAAPRGDAAIPITRQTSNVEFLIRFILPRSSGVNTGLPSKLLSGHATHNQANYRKGTKISRMTGLLPCGRGL